MRLFSTNHRSPDVDLKQAVLRSLPADNGLYFPYEIPRISQKILRNLHSFEFAELSYEMATALIGESVPPKILETIVHETLSFDAPLKQLDDSLYVLELFHGPTLAFKDFGARFMARLMAHFLEGEEGALDILVATSGDTGGAVAAGFLNVPGIRVSILYPSGKVSPLQEKQLTTIGNNIRAFEVDGSFDDCQHLVKQAFLDEELNERLNLASANSINIARLIPQSFYYGWLCAQLSSERAIQVSVPSGNFGNLTAGLIAKKMGFPIDRFVAANNVNKVFVDYLSDGTYQQRTAIATLSNAMDVGNPSNFVRLKELYDGNLARIRADIAAYAFDDGGTEAAMKELYACYRYVSDPHGAVGYLGSRALRAKNHSDAVAVFLETAHPSKFIETVERVLDIKVEIPESLARLADEKKVATQIGTDFSAFKACLV